jgi:hypothetical protein
MSFIPVAERYDLMRTIDRWVVDAPSPTSSASPSCATMPAPAEFSINLSGHTLSSPTSPSSCRRSSAQRCRRRILYFEITETAAIANVERARALIESAARDGRALPARRLRQRPVVVQLPQAFPVDGIKIDGLFVKGVAKNYLDYALVESIQTHRHEPGPADHRRIRRDEEIARKLVADRHPAGPGVLPLAAASWETLFEKDRSVYNSRANTKTACTRHVPLQNPPSRALGGSRPPPPRGQTPIENKIAQCQGCHGIPDGRPPSRGLPRAQARRPEGHYIVAALKAYKSGERDFPTMRRIAAPLTRRRWRARQLLRRRPPAARRKEVRRAMKTRTPRRSLLAPPRAARGRLSAMPRSARRSPRLRPPATAPTA